MMSNGTRASDANLRSSPPVARAALRLCVRLAQVVKTTSTPWRTAQWPRACARWLLPVPQGPTMSTGAFSCR